MSDDQPPAKPVLSPDFNRIIPPDDDRERSVCGRCGFIDYENPKIVVGSVTVSGDRILLCKRAIEPRTGFWTLPAGFLELNETPEDGARREAVEEAEAQIEIDRLLAVYAIPRISQVQIFYRARLADEAIAAGPESLEVGLFTWDDIPWGDLAFPSVKWALHHYRDSQKSADFAPYSNPPGADGRP